MSADINTDDNAGVRAAGVFKLAARITQSRIVRRRRTEKIKKTAAVIKFPSKLFNRIAISAVRKLYGNNQIKPKIRIIL